MKSLESMTVMETAEWLAANPKHARASKAFGMLAKLRGSMSEQGKETVDRALIAYKRGLAGK